MAGFMPDTSCMVAAVCAWHEQHRAAAAEVNRRLTLNQPLLLAAPALVESYAVLTRLPPPHRLATTDAAAVLDASFVATGKVIALEPGSYRRLLRQLATDGIAGGRSYDAVIAQCAVKSKASAVLTFNARQFLTLVPAHVDIVVPGASARSSCTRTGAVGSQEQGMKDRIRGRHGTRR